MLDVRAFSKWCLAGVLVAASVLPTAKFAHAQGQVHRVAYGETLANIAYAYGVNSSELARTNGVANTNMLYIGQELTIPDGGSSSAAAAVQTDVAAETGAAIDEIVAVVSEEPVVAAIPDGSSSAFSGYVTVTRGDTLSQIARNHGMSLSEIMRINSIEDASHVWVGQRLYVSGNTATAERSTAASSTSSTADAIYTVTFGDTLSKIAVRYGVSSASLVEANGLPNANHVWIGQKLRIPGGANANVSQTTAWPQTRQSPATYGRKLIEVDLSKQTLTAWQGDQQMLHTYISSGTYETPTVTGRFLVSWKTPNQHMYGDDFDLPNVPWVMYFHEGYAIHGAYWHANFGMPMSHGCVNMVPSQAQFLYEWAPVGTEIWVHY